MVGSKYAVTVAGVTDVVTGPDPLVLGCTVSPITAKSASPLVSLTPVASTALLLFCTTCKYAHGKPLGGFEPLSVTEARMIAQFCPTEMAGDGYTGTCCGTKTPLGVAGLVGMASGAVTVARRGRYLKFGSCRVTSKETGFGQVPDGRNSSVS